jgi:ATP-dependent DNA helicase RecG
MDKKELIAKLEDIEWEDFEVKEELNAFLRDSAFGTKDKRVTRFKLKDLDKDTLNRFRNNIKNLDSANPYSDLSESALFEKLRVTIDGKVTIAGILMFGNEDTIGKVFSDFMIDYLEIRGTSYTDAPERYTYRMPLQKNLYNYFFSIFERLLTRIDIPFKTTGIFREENQPQVLAIREALVNLLAHSDYFSAMKPRIRVFLNRIEFMNPGSLPASVEVLRKQELTLPRNPILIKIFRVLKLAENAGYGFDKMFNGWKSYYNVEPIVENEITFYKIEFPLKTRWEKYPKKYPKKYPEKYPENINDTQKAIIDLIYSNNKISREEIANKIGLSLEGIKKNIKLLKERNLLRRIGPDKGGYWKVLE